MTVLMSFKPSVFNKIIDQIKIIEYRRNFPKNCSYAYMYVSKPVQAICGIIYFGNNYSLLAWQNEYKKMKQFLEELTIILINIDLELK